MPSAVNSLRKNNRGFAPLAQLAMQACERSVAHAPSPTELTPAACPRLATHKYPLRLLPTWDVPALHRLDNDVGANSIGCLPGGSV